jgi:hypothetical protein
MTNFEPLSFLVSILLIIGISLNLLSIKIKSNKSTSIKVFSLSITFSIIAIITPHYYHSFDVNLLHFLEHSVFKMLFILAAINVQFFLGIKIRRHLGINKLFEHTNTIFYIIENQDKLEQVYKKVELDIFERGLYRLTTRATHFIEKVNQLSSSIDLYTRIEHIPHYVEDILHPIDQNVNRLWTDLVKKSERIPHVLSRIQTGLLSNNLILILSFLLIFIVLLYIIPGG